MIPPTIGRIVWFYPANGTKEQAALITDVNEDGTVNLSVYAPDGHASAHQNVPLDQDTGDPSRDRCAWMPFQKGQAAKTEVLTEQLARAQSQNS